MKHIGFFKEMSLYYDGGSIDDFLTERINYNKPKVINYLKSAEKVASCPREAIDCKTNRPIQSSFAIYTDKDRLYDWGDFLIYHIEKYNIKLPEEFLKKIEADIGESVHI